MSDVADCLLPEHLVAPTAVWGLKLQTKVEGQMEPKVWQ